MKAPNHAQIYLRILNPDTGRWVLSRGRKGKEIIRTYMSFVRTARSNQLGAGNVFHFNIFYAEWCGYCKIAMPQFKKMAMQHTNSPNIQVHMYDVDDTVHADIKAKHSVVSYPTITGTLGDTIYRYEGERDVSSFNKWIESLRAPA
tara:strand:- start:3491 stop:3928 length:438 start_codon:yes stop_codon:yes gene_type:complete